MIPSKVPLYSKAGLVIGSTSNILNIKSNALTPAGSLPCIPPKTTSNGPPSSPWNLPITLSNIYYYCIYISPDNHCTVTIH